MSFCGEKRISFGSLCVSTEDYYMIVINIIILGVLLTILYFKYQAHREKLNKTVNVKYNFTMLGEGPLNYFYSTSTVQQKSSTTKKKVQSKAINPVLLEKTTTNNELKCNNCNRTVDLSYQYTLNKLQNVQTNA
jgi:hypothetical protein